MNAVLYQSGYSPRGVRKSWERCSMDVSSTVRSFGYQMAWGNGNVVEAVGWFDDKGATRVLIADFDSGDRVTVRKSGRDWMCSVVRGASA